MLFGEPPSLTESAAMFDGPTIEVIDARRDYGEVRMKAIGAVRGVCLVCVYTDRGEVRRIVSLRLANRKERDEYGNANQG
ncbi:MAG: BrnT family toxin [Caulobacteraceae bacterium]